jgi:hypothetical protein
MATPEPAPAPVPAPPAAPTIWQAFVGTLAELVGSKKALVLFASIGAWVALKLGWHVDEATIETYLKFVLAPYLVGQGIADHGKGAAEEHGRTARALVAGGVPAGQVLSVVKPSRSPAAGFVRTSVLVCISVAALLAAAVGGMVGCSHPGQVVLATGQCVLDNGVLTKVLVDLGQANYAALIGDAFVAAPALVKCALQAIAASEAPAPPDAGVGSAGSGTQLRRGPYDHVLVERAKEMLAKHGGAK